jgi:glycerophosphoryl diester phosphodiesterase
MYSRASRPLAISHRGLRSAGPENTIPAFVAAIDAGAEGVELDVHGSSDDVLFVHHDPVLEVGGVMRPIASLESGEIARVRLPGGIPVPSLDDTISAIGSRAFVFIEIKAAGIESSVARCLRRHMTNIERYCVHAFDHRVVKRVLELIPSVRTGALQVSYLIDSPAALRRCGAVDLWQHTDFIDRALVTDIHASGGKVIAWTPNDEAEWQALAEMGVDGICTDRVDQYAAWLAAREETRTLHP